MKWMIHTLVVFACLASPAMAVNLTFENRSSETIPLEIPGVMNPNLSPMSQSGVTLNPGQMVYFKINGQRKLLLEIKDEKNGQVIVVNELIVKRTAEIKAQK